MGRFFGLRLAGLYPLGRSTMSHKIKDLDEAVDKNEMRCKEYRQWSSVWSEVWMTT
jgi:hypothetical protein